MLKKLSKRNAKRQAMDYIIYIITLVITVVLMLSFNMVVFSEEISAIIKEPSILPFLIVVVSIMVVFIMGALVNHITVFILKRRSREFGLYMLLGIENEDIAGIFLRENRSIHGFILAAGLFLGTCFFQAVQAVICGMYAVPFSFSFEVSAGAVILTLFYMGAILGISSVRVKRAVRKLNVRELIYFDKAASGDGSGEAKDSTPMALLSVLLGIVGIAVMVLSAVRNLPDIVNVLAVTFLVVSVYGFFVLLFRRLLSCLKSDEWKYRGNRLFLYRQLTAKMRSMLPLMAGASMLVMVALLAVGWAICFMDKVDSRVEAVAFDIAFFKDEENADFSPYLSYLDENHELESSYGYSLYTSHDDTFYQQTKNMVQGKMGFYISGNDEDIFMCISDYNRLRDMLDLPQVQIDSGSYVLHCTEPGIAPLADYIGQSPFLIIGDAQYRFDGIYSEDFMQQESKGNGNGVLVIVPDRALSGLDFHTCVMAVDTQSELPLSEIREMETIGSGISIISKTGVRNRSASMAVYTVFPLLYLAFVLSAVACTILSVQILSEAKNEVNSYQILDYLGVGQEQQKKMMKKQVALLYFLPVLPAAFIDILVFPMMTGRIVRDAGGMVQIISVAAGMKQIGIAVGLFFVFFILYYIGTIMLYARITIKKR